MSSSFVSKALCALFFRSCKSRFFSAGSKKNKKKQTQRSLRHCGESQYWEKASFHFAGAIQPIFFWDRLLTVHY